MEEKMQYQGTGRRKHAVARVVLTSGSGKITVNEKDIKDYFGRDILVHVIKQPLEVTDTIGQFDVDVTVEGGGISGQSEAVRHGIARALLEVDEDEYRGVLKKEGFLTRDPRMKERKKYGLKKARRAPQFSKR